MTAIAAAATDHDVAFQLVSDAADLLDVVEPGSTTLAEHTYGQEVSVRTRRVDNDRQDSLTLIAYQGGHIAGTVIVTRTSGGKITARIHQMNIAGLTFTRSGNWTFTAVARAAGQRRRFILTAARRTGWQLAVTGAEPTTWADLGAAAAHLAATYHPGA